MRINSLRLSLAISMWGKSLARKLPIILLTAFACYSLEFLDDAKRHFDFAKAQPLRIDEDFKNRLAVEVTELGGGKEWTELQEYITVPQFTTADQFVNKLAAQISLTMEPAKFRAQETLKVCVAKAIENELKTDPGKTPDQSKPLEMNHASGKNLPAPSTNAGQSVAAAFDTCSYHYNESYLASYKATETKIANVYHYLKPIKLEEIRRQIYVEKQIPIEEPGLVERTLEPVLDDKQGLYVIYQVFRISCVVIIVVSLITVIALLLRTIFFNEGVGFLTGQANTLIDAARGAVLPNIAKTAVVSAAALGIGTAVAAGVAINNKADQALGFHQDAGYQTVRSNRNPPPGRSGPNGSTATRDGKNVQYAYDNDDAYYYNIANSTNSNSSHVLNKNTGNPGNDSEPRTTTIVLGPEITSTLDRYLGATQQTNIELVGKVNSALDSFTKSNATLTSKLDTLKPSNPTEVSNHKKADTPEALLVDFERKPDIKTIPEQFAELNKSVLGIEKVTSALEQLQRGTLDRPTKPSAKRSIFGSFFPSSQYFLSKRATDQLRELIAAYQEAEQKTAAAVKDPTLAQLQIQTTKAKRELDELIRDALNLVYLSGGKPMGDKALIAKIEEKFKGMGLDETKLKNGIKRLEYWRTTILTYSRVS